MKTWPGNFAMCKLNLQMISIVSMLRLIWQNKAGSSVTEIFATHFDMNCYTAKQTKIAGIK